MDKPKLPETIQRTPNPLGSIHNVWAKVSFHSRAEYHYFLECGPAHDGTRSGTAMCGYASEELRHAIEPGMLPAVRQRCKECERRRLGTQ